MKYDNTLQQATSPERGSTEQSGSGLSMIEIAMLFIVFCLVVGYRTVWKLKN